MSITTIEVPDEAELLAAAQQAQASHLHLITDGQRTVLSPFMLPGYRKVIVKVKPQPEERIAA